jgi:hypothetical protein
MVHQLLIPQGPAEAGLTGIARYSVATLRLSGREVHQQCSPGASGLPKYCLEAKQPWSVLHPSALIKASEFEIVH